MDFAYRNGFVFENRLCACFYLILDLIVTGRLGTAIESPDEERLQRNRRADKNQGSSPDGSYNGSEESHRDELVPKRP